VPRQILAKPWLPKPLRKLVSSALEKYEDKIARECDAIITATVFIRERFLKQNKNTVDINNFPILKDFATTDAKAKNNTIIYVGGITRIRGIIEMIKSVERANATLVLAGNFDKPELQKECEALTGWKHVDYHGFVNREKITELLYNSAAGIVTLQPTINYLDSLPIKMFEYMLAGIPVIASDFPFWKDIIEKYECGICVDPMNPVEIAKAIKTILGDKDLAVKMGENGKKVVLEKYNWEVEEKKLLELYASL
jgi:glycosyltransferase involved in cell wall biosynthesis